MGGVDLSTCYTLLYTDTAYQQVIHIWETVGLARYGSVACGRPHLVEKIAGEYVVHISTPLLLHTIKIVIM